MKTLALAVTLALAGTTAAGEPAKFTVVNNCPSQFTVANTIPACKCGCMETGQCRCKNCCERTADPTWKPERSQATTFKNVMPDWAGSGYYDRAGRWHAYPKSTASMPEDQSVQACDGNTCRLVKVSGSAAPTVGWIQSGPTYYNGPVAGGCSTGACGPTTGFGSYGAGGACAGRSCSTGGGRKGFFGRCK